MIKITMRRPDGTVFEAGPWEYGGILCDPEGRPSLYWYLYKPDSCTDEVALEWVTKIEVVSAAGGDAA